VQTWADRAVATYAALQEYFYRDDGTGLFSDRYPSDRGLRYATAWGFGRALIGTLALAGIPAELLGERRHAEFRFAVQDRLTALAHYWDASSSPPGFHGRPVRPIGSGGSKYYDDNAWLGLALLQDYRMTGRRGSLRGAEAVWAFVYPGGWDTDRSDPYPGGIFWVQQGVGVGLANHDRTCTSNAPNAEIAFQLEQLLSGKTPPSIAQGAAIQDWVLENLYDHSTGLFCDMVMGDGTVDTTLRTYNQGAVIAANVMRYRTTEEVSHLSQAEKIARAALSYFSESFYVSHSYAFNAIYFRGLLQLYTVTGDTSLKNAIMLALETYAEDVWNNYRSPNNLFSFPASQTTYQLLDQGAMLQILASLAWDPRDYPMLG
jgi:Glycosyl hydrolase family 76